MICGDAARHGQKSLVRVQLRADGVAQAEPLTQVQKQFRRHAAAVERVQNEQYRQVGVFHACAEAIAHGELRLRDRERLGHVARLLFERIHADIGADVLVDLAARHRGEHIREDARNALSVYGAAVEDLHRARREQVMVAHRQLAVVDALGVRLLTEAGHGEILAAAHMGVQALACIAALVVHGRADARDQLRALTVDDVRPQQAAARVRVQQQVGHIGRQPGKDFLAEYAVVGKIGLEAHGLYFSQLVHDRRNVRAVEPVKLGCDRLQIGQTRAPAPQHIRQHGRAGGRFTPQLRQQIHAQPRGLEFLRAQGGQPHAGQDLRADALHNCAPFPDGCFRFSGIHYYIMPYLSWE